MEIEMELDGMLYVNRLSTLLLASLAAGLVLGIADAQEAVVLEETPIVLHASAAAPDQLLKSEYHQVADRVVNDGYMNHYDIETPFGTFTAEGNAALRIRINEIHALAQLEDVTKTSAFADAMKRSATYQAKAIADTVQHPVKTAKGVPGGVNRFVKRTARKAKDISQDVEEGYHEVKDRQEEKKAEKAAEAATKEEQPPAAADNKSSLEEGQEWWDEKGETYAKKGGEVSKEYAKDWIGYSDARRHWAKELEVDPYTDNKVLSKELNRVSQAATAGDFAMRWVPVPKLDVLGTMKDVNDLVWDTDPLDLRMRNEKLLYEMGASKELVRMLYDNNHQSPTLITVLVDALTKLDGVEGRDYWVEHAATSTSRVESEFHLRAVNFYAAYHTEKRPLDRVVDGRLYPQILTTDGRLVLVAPVDHLHWTEDIAYIIEEATPRLLEQTGAGAMEGWIEGGCSENTRRALEGLGYEVHINAFLGLDVTFGEE
jgi:hypothetical protein